MAVLKNPKHEEFCRLIADGRKKGEAYREALGTNAKSAHVSANALLKTEKVSLRIKELREAYQAHVAEIEAEAVAISESKQESYFATKDEILKIMTDTIRAKPSAASLDNPLCELRMSKQGPYPAFIDKSKAAERICKIMGYDAAEHIHHEGEIKIAVMSDERRKQLMEKKQAAILRRHATPPLNASSN